MTYRATPESTTQTPEQRADEVRRLLGREPMRNAT